VILTNLKMMDLITELDPSSTRDNIKSIAEINQKLSSRPPSILVTQLMCQIYTAAYSDAPNLDWLSSMNSQAILDFGLKSMNQSPLINMKQAIKLMNAISTST
jgi:hypothetical protein